MGCRVLPDKEICELSCEEERINVLLKNKLQILKIVLEYWKTCVYNV